MSEYNISSDDLPLDPQRYQIEGSIGAGGFGKVFKAYDKKLIRDVAIKVIPSERATNLLEAQALARIDHPNIVKVFDLIQDERWILIVMEYVEEKAPLNLESIAFMDENEFYEFFIQVIEAVSAIHEHGLLHLDLKPENILLDQYRRVKVTDFGISVDMKTIAKNEQTFGNKGSWFCATPEHIQRGASTTASDIFALGVLWYIYLYKRHPFLVFGDLKSSRDNLLTGKLIHSEIPGQQKVPPYHQKLLYQMLDTNPKKRPNLEGLRQHIGIQLNTSSSTLLPTETVVLHEKSKHKIKVLLFASVLACAFIIFGLYNFLPPHEKTTMVVPTQLALPSDRNKHTQYEGYNLLVAKIIEDELEAAVVLDQHRRLVSKKEWQGTRNWTNEAKQVDVDEILVSEVFCGEEYCNIDIALFDRDKNNTTYISNKRIPHIDLSVLSQAIELTLTTEFPFNKTEKLSKAIDDQTLRLYYQQKLKLSTFDDAQSDLSMLESLAAENPNFVGPHTLLAESYLQIYNKTKNSLWLEKAQRQIKNLKQNFNQHHSVLRVEFEYHLHSNNIQEAARLLERLKDSGGVDLGEYLLSEAKMLFKQDHEQGYEALLNIAHPRLTQQYYHLKAHMEDRLNYHEAQRTTALAWQNRFKDSDLAQYYLASSLVSLGEVKQALTIYQKLYDKKPEYYILFNLGLSQFLLGLYPQSIQSFEEIVKLNPSAEALVNLGEALKAANDPRYPEYFQRALVKFQEITKPSSLSLAYHALTLAHLNRPEEALIFLQQSAREQTKDKSFFLVAAYVYSLIGQPKAAYFNAKEAEKRGFRPHWFNLPWTQGLFQLLTTSSETTK